LVCGECVVELSLFYRKLLSVGRLLPPRHPCRIHKETAQPAARNWSWLVELKDRSSFMLEMANNETSLALLQATLWGISSGSESLCPLRFGLLVSK